MRIVGYRVIAAGGALALVAFPMLAWAGSVSSAWSDVVEPGVLPLAFYLAGLVAFLRRPGNPATGRLVAFGAAHLAAYALASLAAVMLQQGWSGAWLVNLCAGLLYGVGFAVCLALFAVFPDGRYERRYERVGARLAVIGAAALTLTGLLARAHPDLVLEGFTPGHTGNPLHLASIDGLAGIEFLTVLGLPASVVFFTLRYRRARGERREQMRWPLAVGLAGIAALVLSVAPDTVVPGGAADALFVAVFTLLPVSLVVGMLRHRLFDVELIIRRSVIFGALWAVIALLYVAVAAVLGIAAGTRLPTTVAVLVAVVAAMAFRAGPGTTGGAGRPLCLRRAALGL